MNASSVSLPVDLLTAILPGVVAASEHGRAGPAVDHRQVLQQAQIGAALDEPALQLVVAVLAQPVLLDELLNDVALDVVHLFKPLSTADCTRELSTILTTVEIS
jgi:hypothetical protein